MTSEASGFQPGRGGAAPDASEARTVATIEHPNVCTIYEISTEGERPYIVMQYGEGETQADRMRRGRLTLSETIDVACLISAALSEAHNRRIVHRDIKPGNVMLTSSGFVKVLDFGRESQPC
jgi:serine/threonine protein kinase